MEIKQALKEIGDFIKEKEELILVSDYDADGLSSASILSKALDRIGKKHKIIPTKHFDSARIKEISEQGKNFIFLDQGSGNIKMIEKYINDFAIIDHHETLEERNELHLNAHLFGLDGNIEICSSGLSYLVAKELDEKNKDLSGLAIIGAIGDMQDSTGHLIGFNRKILDEAEKAGIMEHKKDIRLFGRHSRPLVQFIAYSTEPVFPSLTGNEEACIKLLNDIDIPIKRGDEWLYYVDLDEEQKKRLISALYVYGKRNFIPEEYLQSLVGEIYEFIHEKDKSFVKDAKDFSTLINACGRHEQPFIGIEVEKGDRGEYYKKAENLLHYHRRILREGIEFAKQKGIEEKQNIYVLDAGDAIKDTIIGVVAGMLYGGTIEQDKPVIAFSLNTEKNRIKVSARANWLLVRKGLHLGKIMSQASKKFSGEGGGHSIAAGAHIPIESKEDFTAEVDRLVGELASR